MERSVPFKRTPQERQEHAPSIERNMYVLKPLMRSRKKRQTTIWRGFQDEWKLKSINVSWGGNANILLFFKQKNKWSLRKSKEVSFSKPLFFCHQMSAKFKLKKTSGDKWRQMEFLAAAYSWPKGIWYKVMWIAEQAWRRTLFCFRFPL